MLLFYTAAARVSDFIQQTELPTALARSDAKQCTLLWVPLEQRLKKLQRATRGPRSVYDFEIVQKGWMEVEQAIPSCGESARLPGTRTLPSIHHAAAAAAARIR